MEFKLQKDIMAIMKTGDWYTVGEVAISLGLRTNTSVRCILETLVFAEVLQRAWGRTERQPAYYYRLAD